MACHADVTAAQCAERKIIRSKARKQLKDALKELKNLPKKTRLSADENKKVCLQYTGEDSLCRMSYKCSIKLLFYLFCRRLIVPFL